MKRWLIIIGVLIALPIVGLGAYIIAYFTVDPSFDAAAYRDATGAVRIEVDPNFVVYSVRHVTIEDASRVLVEQEESVRGVQSIDLPAGIAPGSRLTVTCFLVYDRPMPSATTRQVTVVVP